MMCNVVGNSIPGLTHVGSAFASPAAGAARGRKLPRKLLDVQWRPRTTRLLEARDEIIKGGRL
ncbi:hypothetical protein QC761_0031720 [Podospora bellae-mahoneyi]|uniref:Uncharacterized protein n=1 Tax=Podospora bellae-mahoneyi TaxID=2093777 RepID=A0ABR0FN48_9PEZI|nr:hypothetical protein QC761_0031720 [Podospora bellae-mahoneyi]